MEIFSFYTIQSPSEGIYKEKGSKFLAFAFPVNTEEEVKEKILALKKEYYDARHHCYAYILGADKSRFRAVDDGEPGHSAGDPILGQIRSKNLTNVLVVVVRYFGGVKLGVGGLISAYKQAAEDALINAVIVEREVMQLVKLSYDYAFSAETMRLVKEFDIIIRDQGFTDRAELKGELRLKDYKPFLDKLQLLNATGNSIQLDE